MGAVARVVPARASAEGISRTARTGQVSYILRKLDRIADVAAGLVRQVDRVAGARDPGLGVDLAHLQDVAPASRLPAHFAGQRPDHPGCATLPEPLAESAAVAAVDQIGRSVVLLAQ